MTQANSSYNLLSFPEPQVLNRKPEKQKFVPLPSRNYKAHGGALSAGIDSLKKQISSLTPEQKQAVYLRLQSASPLQEADLKRLSLIPIRQEGKTLTVALPLDHSFKELQSKINAYAASEPGKPKQASVVANLSVAPTMLSIQDRMSDSFAKDRSRLVAQKFVHVQVEVGPLGIGDGTPASLRKGVDQALARLKTEVERNGSFYDLLWARDGLSVTVNIGLPGKTLSALLEKSEFGFITWFDVLPSFQTVAEELSNLDIAAMTISPPATSDPLVCVIDSGVVDGHALIKPAIRKGMSQCFNNACGTATHDESNHGTGVASIALYYDVGGVLKKAAFNASAWLANARILDKTNSLGPGQLFGTVLESAIRHFNKLGCRIFNLSVNDSRRPFGAKTALEVCEVLDSLARELDVLIVVSTGNLNEPDLNDALKRGVSYPEVMFEGKSKILDPAQAVNVLTVGSVADSHKSTNINRKPVAFERQPSPFTRSGPGINDFIKPELVECGGNILVDNGLKRYAEDAGCSVVAASSDIGKLVQRSIGTSLSSPRVVNIAARTLVVLQQFARAQGIPLAVGSNLLRAMIVNSARVHPDAIDLFSSKSGRQKKAWIDLCGYGEPSLERATVVNKTRAVLFYQGRVEIDKVSVFSIPVPRELVASGKAIKKICVSLAYMPPVRRGRTSQYCGTRMQWRLFRGDVSQDDVLEAMTVNEDGTEKVADLPKEIPGAIGFQLRSRSTVQHDEFSWTRHKATYSVHPYTLAVVARRNWDTATQFQDYAVVVSVECESPTIDIATLIAAKIKPRIAVKTR